ncbi:hypothetical protein [Sinorhizobium meliloti]|uniref:hypothetical protein n=1 Tax=Rhizobium meliloti TaxID=382 RepID=UPI001072AB04|nr:hypothetical protein [Sinorhizobium meliloti]MQW29257.1 hypothetical protein [Sinorhizobium meliloti]
MEKQAVDTDTKRVVLESFATLYPWMRSFHTRPVRDYAVRLFDFSGSRSGPEPRLRSFTKLLKAIQRAGRRNGLSSNAVAKICEEFEARPVMQTGPHLLLLIEPEAYYSHVFSLLGLSAHGCSSYVSYAVSTVNLVEKPRKGPGWLNVDGQPVNVFGLSRSQMIPYSLLSGPGSYRFELKTVDASVEGDALERLRNLLPKTQFERPAHALKAANLRLWPKLFGTDFTFLQIDDEDIADLVADHLSDGTSWLRARLFGDSTLAACILAELDKLAAGPWCGWLPRSTDFFWFYDNGKRLPLRLVAGEFVHPATGLKAARFTAPEIVERLADRSLIPNLLLMFLVLSILPGVRVLGGSHHPVYYPLMRYVVCRALEATGVDADLRHALATDDTPGAWGHRIIECSDEPFKQLRNGGAGGLDESLDRFGRVPLADVCGSMSSFVTDRLWQELRRNLRESAITPVDEEWAYS